MAPQTRARVFRYGLGPESDLWADEIAGEGLEGIRFRFHYQGDVVHVRVPLLGRHSVHTALRATAVGLIEGLTEFIPVSSTGHLLLAGHFLGFESPGRAFEVLIQLGAILAILLVYFRRLLDIVLRLRSDPAARRFVIGVLVAFLPAALIGAVLHGFIKSVLFNPFLVCCALIAGGLVLLVVDELELEVKHTDATAVPRSMDLKIGFIQCLAMIPGVSRSGSTIVGAMLLGASKRAAAEFSFFLAMPTMAGAFAYDLFKNHKQMNFDNSLLVGVGFVVSFVAALLVVKTLLDYVTRHGFAPFAWWRVIIGTLGLIGLALGF